MPAAGTLRGSPALSAGLAFAAFGADIALASTGMIGKPLALLLLIVPTALLYRAMRLAGGSAGAGACQPKGEAQRRYVRRVMAFTAAYLLAFALQALVAGQSHQPVPLRAALGLLPALAILGVFWAIGRLIVEETDEFMRMLVVRQVLVATALTLSAATLWGFLEAADAVPHVDAYWIAMFWFFGQFAGAVANRVTYGSWGAL